MKEKILEILRSRQQKPTSMTYLQEAIGVTTKEAFTQLVKTCNELEESAIIIPNKEHAFRLLEYSGCVKGILRINQKGFGFVDGEEASVYISEKNINNAMDGDTVLASVATYADGQTDGTIIKILCSKRTHIVGNIRIRNNNLCFLPDDETIHQDIKIINKQDYALVDGHKILLKILSYGKVLTCEITQIIGHVHDPGTDISGVLLEYGFESKFPDAVQFETKLVPDFLLDSDREGRVDLTKETIFTIDGDSSKDFDDAVSIKKISEGIYRLGVHIADVSHYVRENTPLDQEAYNRSTSVYVVDRVVPMLPHELSNGICSLNPHVERLTITCEMDINADGDIQDYRIYPSIIRSCERMTYNNVNKMLDGYEPLILKYQHLYKDLIMMAQLSEIIRQKRENKGCIDFDQEEAEIILNEQGHVIDIRPRVRGFAERMIEDFMISANECVARHMRWLEYPCLYRVHDKPSSKKMKEFVHVSSMMGYPFKGNSLDPHPTQFQSILEQASGSDAFPILSMWMLRTMSKAKYAPSCNGHFGLALEDYLHFTSPIRRYPDLIVHRMLRRYYFEQCTNQDQLNKDMQLMEDYAEQTSIQERAATECEREVDDIKKAEYMEHRIGKIYSGVISGMANFGLFVQLPNTIEGCIRLNEMKDDYYHYFADAGIMKGERTGKEYRLGQKVRIRVVGANRFQQHIDFEFVSDRHTERKPNPSNKGTSRNQKTRFDRKDTRKKEGHKHGKKRSR